MLAVLTTSAKALLKLQLAPLIYRYPPIGLQPERLQLWLRAVMDTANVDGAIVEVGCNLCGTSAFTTRLMQRLKIDKCYVCVDTFGGFVDEQFEADQRNGTPAVHKDLFSSNSIDLARKVLSLHAMLPVQLVQGDIAKVADDQLPARVSLALIDVDLAIPVYESLRRLWPRLAPGGVILVDDCPESTDWKARDGVARFCREMSITEQYDCGMGVFRKPLAA